MYTPRGVQNCPACFEAPKERARVKLLLASQEHVHPSLFSSLLKAMRPLIGMENGRLDSQAGGDSDDDVAMPSNNPAKPSNPSNPGKSSSSGSFSSSSPNNPNNPSNPSIPNNHGKKGKARVREHKDNNPSNPNNPNNPKVKKQKR